MSCQATGSLLTRRDMIRTFTAFLMILIGTVNALSLGAEERAPIGGDLQDIELSLQPDSGSGDENQGDCKSQHGDRHQCHLGHCPYLVGSTAALITIPAVLSRPEFADLSWMSVSLPSSDKPPRA